MNRITKEEFFKLFDPSVHDATAMSLEKYKDAVGIVVFENQCMDSSSLGSRSAVVVGPSNTYKTVDALVGRWLNDLPSQRQYATSYILRTDLVDSRPVDVEKE